LRKFKATLADEVDEIDEIGVKAEEGATPIEMRGAGGSAGDVIVYCRSEALKYGLPLEAVLDIIMDSNESKLVRMGSRLRRNRQVLKGRITGSRSRRSRVAALARDGGLRPAGAAPLGLLQKASMSPGPGFRRRRACRAWWRLA